MNSIFRECSVCHKKIYMYYRDLSNYVYKTKKGQGFKYQCSYTCHMKEIRNNGIPKRRITS